MGQRPDVQRARLIGNLAFCENSREDGVTGVGWGGRGLLAISSLNANDISGNSCSYLEQLDFQTTLAVYEALTSPDTVCYSPASDYIRLAARVSSGGETAEITSLSENP